MIAIIKDNSRQGWIGVDLDGTLARYEHGQGISSIGEPIPLMLDRVRNWVKDGQRVKIFTARADRQEQIVLIKEWLDNYDLGDLEVTNVKDFLMIELWDDRAIQVVTNTGVPVTSQTV